MSPFNQNKQAKKIEAGTPKLVGFVQAGADLAGDIKPYRFHQQYAPTYPTT